MMANTDLFLKKLEAVFDFFENNDDLALLWRPHPLSISTLLSRASIYYQEYIDLVSYYKKNNIGIYDDTPDLHRSLAISDGYYGDGGSLLALYDRLEKPMIYQNIVLTNYNLEDNVDLMPFSFFVDEDCIYFTTRHFNGLFKKDIKSGKITFLGSTEFDSINQNALYSKIFKKEKIQNTR